ncbi:hypothetical protein [Halostreptopolyspora alba]|uniref:LPXTG cell wall anchor domain-containing protein n=1 Tax=Halostreptopolyspora alba TaxID=2487137 RepID=A0A3N0EDC1_9ACTN|nr:hypothetical protein EFW17_07815 [Nocardiopsaceae bacterium YIM 96095]
MRGLRGCLRAGVSSLVVCWSLTAPTAVQAQPADQTAEWTTDSTGCTPVTAEQPISARTGPGLTADTVFVLNDGVTYTPVLPDTGDPSPPSDTSEGELTLTLELLTDQSGGEPWTDLEQLGFDVSAMKDPDPEPIEVEVGISGARDVDTDAVRAGDIENAGMVTLLESDALPADAWNRAFGAYAVVAADLALHTSNGDPWCRVEFRGSTDAPLERFRVVPSGGAIDAATEDNREDNEGGPPHAPLAVGGALAALLAGAGLLWRRRATADTEHPPGKSGARPS